MEPKRNKNYIAGIYLRLSRDDERAGESLSIENQKILVTKYVKEKGWEIKDVYVDDGYSGTNFDRPGVKRLLDDAKEGEINTIVVKDLSRFGRNYILVGQYIDYVFPSFGIRFIAIITREMMLELFDKIIIGEKEPPNGAPRLIQLVYKVDIDSVL